MDSLDDLLLEEILQPRTVDKLDPSKILELCRHINERKIGGGRKAVRAAKISLFAKDPVVQLHALTLLDALVSNCTNIFHDFASEHVVDDIVTIVSHRLTPAANQEIANKLVTKLAQHIPLPSVFKEQFKVTIFLKSSHSSKILVSPFVLCCSYAVVSKETSLFFLKQKEYANAN